MKYVNLNLTNMPLLASLPEETLRQLLGAGDIRFNTCLKGRLLHQEGDACETLDIVLSGSLAVERLDEEGEVMRVAVFNRGDCLGGNLLFSKEPVYRLAVTAIMDAQILSIVKTALLRLFHQYPEFLLAYLGDAADNASILEGALTRYANLPIRKRVLNYLKAQRKLQGSDHVLLPLSKKALAALLGVNRSSLSRAIRTLKDEGLLDFDRKSVTLKKEI